MARYSAGMIRATASAGAAVTVLCLPPGGAGATPPRWNGVTWEFVPGQRRSRARSLLSPLPAMAHSCAVPEFRAAFRKLAAGGSWDCVVLDHLQAGWAQTELDRLGAPAADTPTVFVSHNHESAVRSDAVRAGRGPKRLALAWDGAKVRRLELDVARRAAAVTAITAADAMAFGGMVGPARVVPLAPGYDGPVVADRTITESVPRRAVMLGNFEWHLKQENLRRFLSTADPLLAAAGVELRVVGCIPDHVRRALSARLKATSFSGPVDTVGPELDGARIGVIAEPFGGGFKLKSLDYIFHRVPVAALAGNMAGVPSTGGGFLEFADEAALVRGIIAAVDDLSLLNRTQQVAYDACRPYFSWAERGRALRNLLVTVSRPPSASGAANQPGAGR